jgi:hypothetical protein
MHGVRDFCPVFASFERTARVPVLTLRRAQMVRGIHYEGTGLFLRLSQLLRVTRQARITSQTRELRFPPITTQYLKKCTEITENSPFPWKRKDDAFFFAFKPI